MDHDELSKIAYGLVDDIGKDVVKFYDDNPEVGADFYRVTAWALSEVLLRTINAADAHQPGNNYSELLGLLNRYVAETYVPLAPTDVSNTKLRSYQ